MKADGRGRHREIPESIGDRMREAALKAGSG